MKRFTFYFLVVTIFLTFSFVLASAQLPVVRIGSFDKPSFGHTSGTLIKVKEFDKKNGIDIQWSYKSGRASNMDFATGRDKITHSSALLSEANRRVKGVKSVYLFSVVNLHGALLTWNPEIQSLKDLEGKTVAANTVTTNYAMFRYFAYKAGVDLKKVKILSTNTPGLATFLLAKRADAIHVWEPNYSKLLFENPGRFHMIEYVHQWQATYGKPMRGYLGVAAHEDWISGNRDTIQKVYNAFKDLAAWVPGHHEEAATIINKATGIPREAFLMVLKTNRYALDVVASGTIKESIKAIFRAGLESGYLKKLPDDGIFYTGLKE